MSDQRRYTINEIDQMRNDMRRSYPNGVPYDASERSAEIEDRLRTYMAAGIDPADIRKKRDEAISQQTSRMSLHSGGGGGGQ